MDADFPDTTQLCSKIFDFNTRVHQIPENAKFCFVNVPMVSHLVINRISLNKSTTF